MKLQKESLKIKQKSEQEHKVIVQHDQQQLGNTLQLAELVLSSTALTMQELLQIAREVLKDKEIQSYLRFSQLKSISGLSYAG